MLSSIKRVNIFASDAEVLVCPTNAGGVMGSGLARYFRERVPGLYSRYKAWCNKHNPRLMVPYVFPGTNGEPIVYCFHTKKHWRENSSLDIIRAGLSKLEAFIEDNNIKSVAIPALGCGKGQLEWEDVKPLLFEFANNTKALVTILEP